MGKLSFFSVATIPSRLSRPETLGVLRSLIGGEGLPFVGRVGADGFDIVRITEYRSSFLPFMRGRIVDGDGGGAAVRITVRPHREVLLFMAVWYLFLLLFFSLALLLGTGASRLLVAVPLGLGAATWILGALVFESDSRWALRAFEEAFEEGMSRVSTPLSRGRCGGPRRGEPGKPSLRRVEPSAP